MKRNGVAATLAIAAMAGALLAAENACAMDAAARQRELEQGQQELKSLSPEALKNSFIGTWNDERGRFWFAIDEIAGIEVRSAQFRLAHLKNGHVEGEKLVLVSMSCVPIIGCYEYTINGTLVTPSRMDMYATDDNGETVYFMLVRE